MKLSKTNGANEGMKIEWQVVPAGTNVIIEKENK